MKLGHWMSQKYKGEGLNTLLMVDQNGCRWSSQEDFCLLLTKKLQEKGGTCVLAYSSPPADHVASTLMDAGAIVEVVARNQGTIIDFCRKVRNVCIKYGIDIVHLRHYSISTWVTFALPLFVPARIIMTDDSGGLGGQKGILKRTAFYLFNRLMNIGVSHFVAPSAFIYKRFIGSRGFSASRITKIPNGVDLERFSPRTDGNSIRATLGVPPDAKVILVACNLYKLKGVDVLLRSFADVAVKAERAVLIIAGDGPELENLQRLAYELKVEGNVLFLGQRSDMQDLFAAADLFCSPSVWGEAFGLVNAEAMACGVPVISTLQGATSEVVEHGETGLLVPPGDVRAMGDAIMTLLGDEEMRKQMGVRGRQRSERLFDLRNTIDAHIALYESN